MDLIDVISRKLDERKSNATQDKYNVSVPEVISIPSRALAYAERHRGQFVRPEYDLEEIRIARTTDSYIARAIDKKVARIKTAGFDFVGKNPETVEYINKRIRHMSYTTGKPFAQLVWETFDSLFSDSNCMWVKKRDRTKSLGKPWKRADGTVVEPIAGYFILPFETLLFKPSANGEIAKIEQRLPSGRTRRFKVEDTVHFYINKQPGFMIGTPFLYPAIEDVALLRRIEESVEDLIDTNLFPVYHYTIGTDQYPERYTPEGKPESELVKRNIQYMTHRSMFVTDHRHKISAVGSEGRALRIDTYMDYFKKRVFAALGVSSVDMGEGGTANRSTASTMSRALLLDVEAVARTVKEFIEFYVISELLVEGGYNPLDESQMVYIKFGVIDKEDRRADENQLLQMFHGNVKTLDEVRQALGDPPLRDEDYKNMHHALFAEPGALIKLFGSVPGVEEALVQAPASMIGKEAAKSVEKAREEVAKVAAGRPQGRPAENQQGKAAQKISSNKAKPANQHGTRMAPKTSKDASVDMTLREIASSVTDNDDILRTWKATVTAIYNELEEFGVSLEAVAKDNLWRLEELINE